jgi:hypothetical protein
MTGVEAQQKLSLPQSEPPNAVYRVRINQMETPVIGPSIVNPTPNPVRSGGVQYYLPYGTPPGSVTGPYALP